MAESPETTRQSPALIWKLELDEDIVRTLWRHRANTKNKARVGEPARGFIPKLDAESRRSQEGTGES